MRKTISLEKILVKNSTYKNTARLKGRLLDAGLLKNRCYECSLPPTWNGKRLSLHLDHIDGDRSNNLISNLRILCPNCHSQTKTYAGKKKRGTAEVFNCVDCGIQISWKSTRCRKCAARKVNKCKVNWPAYEELLKMVEESSYVAVAKQMGCSDVAVKKRLKNCEYRRKIMLP